MSTGAMPLGKSEEMLDESMLDNLHLDRSYNERIRPLLDAIDKLRNLGIMKEGIQLPTIVVVGDQSSGKSSVLESLAGISLPKGQGICTRVPLIMRLQSSDKLLKTEISIECNGTTKHVSEFQITEALNVATNDIAGSAKGISDTPITLNVRKINAPNLTMVDLPGITRVPVFGQPNDIYEQISRVIMQYITPKESIILNVLSASVDFPTCESIRMSQTVDERGERTLAVVTKVDKAAEGLLEKVTINAVNIGLGYVCVRNRVGDESHAQARQIEKDLFRMDPHLSKIDKSMVGIPMLAEKLMQIQAKGITKCLPDIVKKIDATLSKRQMELNGLPRKFSTYAEAMIEFMKVMDNIKDMLEKLLVQGDMNLFADEREMHCIACLTKIFKSYSRDLFSVSDANSSEMFLVEEVTLLEEAQGLSLPNFLPHSVFASLLRSRIDSVSERSRDLVVQSLDYVEKVVCRVVDIQTDCYPQLQTASRRALQDLFNGKKAECTSYVEDVMEMQKTIVFTENPGYLESLQKLQEFKKTFMEAIRSNKKTVKLGDTEVNLEQVPKSSDQVEAAFDVRMSLNAYWGVVRLRLVDEIPLHLRFIFQKMVQNDILSGIVNEVVGQDSKMIERILEQSPVIASKRKSLKKSVGLLRKSKSELSKIIG